MVILCKKGGNTKLFIPLATILVALILASIAIKALALVIFTVKEAYDQRDLWRAMKELENKELEKKKNEKE